MYKKSILLILMALLAACGKPHQVKQANKSDEEKLSPGDVVNAAKPSEWRVLDSENLLYITLDSGQVIVELMPLLAPNHVSNTKALVRQGVFDGTNFYRVLDGFVAQGGPMYRSKEEIKPLTEGAYNIAAEFTYDGELEEAYIAFDTQDNYADETGFVDGFAVGRDSASGESWLLHCYGAFAMGRSNDVNSGGVALYIVNGPAQRYLDRNTTVFGRVIAGMEHIQSLQRSGGIHGTVDLTGKNIIQSIKVAADMPAEELMSIEVMDSQSDAFTQLLKTRKNRTGEWFVHQHDYMDACGVPIPIRLQAE
jgi:peptidylprolyl isomerase